MDMSKKVQGLGSDKALGIGDLLASACSASPPGWIDHRYHTITRLKEQGVVTAMCPVLPSATAIKVKSKDQAHWQVSKDQDRI